MFRSLLHGLRCSVHMELAKVCADQSQLQTALEHINKVGNDMNVYIHVVNVTVCQP